MKTKIIKINPQLVEPKKVQRTVKVLSEGGLVVYPTETFYGLGAAAFSPRAIRRIYRLKKRDRAKPLLVLVSGLEMVEEITRSIPPVFWPLAQEFWPGPLTLVLKASPDLPLELTGARRTIGVRLPDVAWLREVVRQLAFPLTATSANISGEKEISEPTEAARIFEGKVDLIVNGGKTRGILPSTVIDLSGKIPAILREGAIQRSKLIKYLKS
jgi:L-threonylcarbamoyladenylate synthase